MAYNAEEVGIIGKRDVWKLPSEPERWTYDEQKLHEKLSGFIKYAEEVLEKKGYCILKHDLITRGDRVTEVIYVGRPDLVRRYLKYWDRF